MYNQKYKRLFPDNKGWTSFSDQLLELVSWKSGSPSVESLSLSLSPSPSFPFQAEFPSGAWRLAKSTYLPWLLRSTQEGAQGRAPSAIQVGTGGLM